MKRKTNKQIIYIVGIVALIGIAVFTTYNVVNNNTKVLSYSESSLTAEETSFNFNEVPINGGDVYHEFLAKNEGTQTVMIEKVYTSCACTTAFIVDESGGKHGAFGMPGHGLQTNVNIEVAPGESVIIEAVYDPAKHGPSGIGFADRSIYIETNSAKSPKLELSFQATVTQ